MQLEGIGPRSKSYLLTQAFLCSLEIEVNKSYLDNLSISPMKPLTIFYNLSGFVQHILSLELFHYS